MLLDDIPQRIGSREGLAKAYFDPDGVLVGFRTLDYCHEYKLFTGGKEHY
jgi:hypothetical protein